MKKIKYMFFVVVALGLMGCQGKIKQCNDLINTINQHIQSSNKFNSQDKSKLDLKAYNEYADEIDKLKEKIAKVSVKDAKLKEMVKEYSDFLSELSAGVRDFGKAMDSKDSEKIGKASKDLSEITAKESPLTSKINQYCHSL